MLLINERDLGSRDPVWSHIEIGRLALFARVTPDLNACDESVEWERNDLAILPFAILLALGILDNEGNLLKIDITLDAEEAKEHNPV